MKFDPSALDRWSQFINGIIDTVKAECGPTQPQSPLIGTRSVNFDRAPQESSDSCSLGDDPELFVELLQTQAATHSNAIEAAVIEWSRTWSPPKLSGEARFYFLFRLRLAQHLIGYAKQGRLRVDLYGEPPDPNDQQHFLNWLLIRAWDAIGNLYLQNWADDARRQIKN